MRRGGPGGVQCVGGCTAATCSSNHPGSEAATISSHSQHQRQLHPPSTPAPPTWSRPRKPVLCQHGRQVRQLQPIGSRHGGRQRSTQHAQHTPAQREVTRQPSVHATYPQCTIDPHRQHAWCTCCSMIAVPAVTCACQLCKGSHLLPSSPFLPAAVAAATLLGLFIGHATAGPSPATASSPTPPPSQPTTRPPLTCRWPTRRRSCHH
jgi:hypothetical protein